MTDPKATLHRYLRNAREALMWKLDGLPEYDIRRPLTPTGTNLLGLVKHLATVEYGYFGDTFGRSYDEHLPWIEPLAEALRTRSDFTPDMLTADMWCSAEESPQDILGLYRRAWAHSDATIETLPLDATGSVPWWSEDHRDVTLHQILVHMIAETHRHAGHADIVRELIDGAAGLLADNDNMPGADAGWWDHYRNQLERVAREAGQR